VYGIKAARLLFGLGNGTGEPNALKKKKEKKKKKAELHV
jgi:hypothetical protein